MTGYCLEAVAAVCQAHGFALPKLTLPRDKLITLLDVPSTATLHVPMPIELTVRNEHPFRSANVAVTL